MSSKKDFCIDRFFWMEMPLPLDELNKVDVAHRIRPYYIFAGNGKGEYYGFACGTKTPRDFVFSKDWLELGKTNIKLARCFKFSQNELTQKNKCDAASKITCDKMDELMKKLRYNYHFDEYPIEVQERVKEYISTCEYTNRDILFNKKTKKLIIVVSKGMRYLCVNMTYVPTKGYAEMMIDGYKCYLDVLNPFYLDDLFGYELVNISSVYEDVFKQRAEEIVYMPSTLDVSNPENLPLGSVICTILNNRAYMFLKINQHEGGIDYLISEKNHSKKKYIFETIPYGFKLNYEFLHILGDEKLTYAKNAKRRERKLF